MHGFLKLGRSFLLSIISLYRYLSLHKAEEFVRFIHTHKGARTGQGKTGRVIIFSTLRLHPTTTLGQARVLRINQISRYVRNSFKESRVQWQYGTDVMLMSYQLHHPTTLHHHCRITIQGQPNSTIELYKGGRYTIQSCAQ